MSDDKHKHVRDRLLGYYNDNETGIWKILGEDPNPDMAGPHHEPELETLSGTYKNVVEYALTLPRFFGWGYGGMIVKMNERVRNIDKMINNQKLIALQTEKTRLLARLSEVEHGIKEELRKAEE